MADPPARKDPHCSADEPTMLQAYLDCHRETFRWKPTGLTGRGVGRAAPIRERVDGLAGE